MGIFLKQKTGAYVFSFKKSQNMQLFTFTMSLLPILRFLLSFTAERNGEVIVYRESYVLIQKLKKIDGLWNSFMI
mgnify:CR=1 FL=1